MLQLTEHILKSKKEAFDPAYLEDRYRTVLVEKLRKKQSEAPARSATAAPSMRNVVNLMEALKASLGQSKPPATSRSRAKPTARGVVAAVAKPASRPVKSRPKQ
jgi:DNA end-binding protein Ku